MSFRRPSAATVLASLALFVALGGVSKAQDAATSAARKISGSTIKDRSIKARQIANSTLTGTQIKNGSIGAAELDTALTARLATVGAPGPAGAKGDTGAAGPNIVPANGVTAAGVRDASLSARDIGRFASTLQDLDFGFVNDGTCKTISSSSVTAIVANEDLSDDALVITPTGTPMGDVMLYAQAGPANTVSVTICNPTTAPINVGPRNFLLVSIAMS